MGKPHVYAIALLAALAALSLFLLSRDGDGGRSGDAAGSDADRTEAVVQGPEGEALVGGPVAPGRDTTLPAAARIDGDVVYAPEDIQIFHETMTWARENRMDTLPIGQIIARTGRRFVDNPYTPQTLELPGPERIVVNLREFDCVTYVESVLALAHMIRDRRSDFESYVEALRRIRYRNGELDGYVSRLHYFSEWIHDNEQLGVVRDITADLGGRPDDETIDFMSSNADAYPSLEGSPERVAEIREIERELSGRTRHYIPQARIGQVEGGIRDGDVIAATSTVRGLDVAHTGFALWIDGRLHLMHAPLVGKSLEISEQPLATRILRIDGQDGIMVARPL